MALPRCEGEGAAGVGHDSTSRVAAAIRTFLG
eukprot:CAMPEP_0203879166 /NCGR_PEP_ID=MMETSP0359-20131031/23671_1 /ASSEMBLY_ACC=CAM_ASM_000338 /TAXON_ID=268821 /ORGANISM="Scrippsiella Hangoei, Strain SHTV-5" /LENGTH=31 /DNA_ID= /DNA_START= /DNA_END= /DNA_ORIENTATION=